jgi:hypothetical protein
MYMKKLLTILVISTALFAGCKKDEEATPKTKSQLIARNWQFQSAMVTVGSLPVNVFNRTATTGNLVDFSKSYMNFKTDGSFAQSILPNTTSTGTWKLNTGETAFVVTSSGTNAVDTWTIDQLSETNLNFSRQIAGNSTDPSDLGWLALIQSYGFPTTAGAKIEVKTVPMP